jgi:hypothetical protein
MPEANRKRSAAKSSKPQDAQVRSAATSKKQSASAAGAKAAQKSGKGPNILIIIAIIAAAAIIGVIIMVPQLLGSVPFSTFKSTFQSASRVSVVATYANTSQYTAESQCFSSIIQVVAHSRKASTIDFFIINQANDTCTYSSTGLGGSVTPVTANSSHCISIAASEPGIFLNYSDSNYTRVTTSHLYVYANGAYMDQCPIAVELS